MDDDPKNATKREVQVVITSALAHLDQEIEELLFSAQESRDLLEAMSRVVNDVDAIEHEQPILDTMEVSACRMACIFFRMSMRRKLLLRAQTMLEEGTLDLKKANLERYGLL